MSFAHSDCRLRLNGIASLAVPSRRDMSVSAVLCSHDVQEALCSELDKSRRYPVDFSRAEETLVTWVSRHPEH